VSYEALVADSKLTIDDEGYVYRPPAVPVVALSYGWIRQGHPDPDGWHLRLVAHLLKLFFSTCPGIKDVALFWDFLSLEQVWGPGFQFMGRTPDENRRFKAALNYMQVIYGHQHIFVWRMNALPDDVLPTVENRGWPHFEQAVFSTSQKPFWLGVGGMIFTVNDRDRVLAWELLDANTAVTWGSLASVAAPPCSPAHFNEQLASKTFTGVGDFEIVVDLYSSLFYHCLSQMTLLRLDLAWTPESAWQLGIALREFRRLETLDVNGDAFARNFSEFVRGHGKDIRHLKLKELSMTRCGRFDSRPFLQFLTCCPNLTFLSVMVDGGFDKSFKKTIKSVCPSVMTLGSDFGIFPI